MTNIEKLLNIFFKKEKILSIEEIEREKKSVKIEKVWAKEFSDKKYKESIRREVNKSFYFYKKQNCFERLDKNSKHHVYLDLYYCSLEDCQHLICKIIVMCSFCGRVPYKNNVSPHFDLERPYVTKEDLDKN